MSIYEGINYQNVSLEESIIRTEGDREPLDKENQIVPQAQKSKHILVVTQYFYPKTFRINNMCQERIKRGYKVTIVTGIPNYPMGKTFEGYGLTKKSKTDYVFSFEVSPMTQVLAGVTFAKKLSVPHYLYVQDLWPENVMTVTGITNPTIIKPIDKMVDYIYKNTDYIFATSPSLWMKSVTER